MAANSYRNVFLTNLDTIPSSGTTLDLGIGELGIVNVRTNTLTSSPNFPTVRSIQVVQGTSDKKLPKGFQMGNQTLRTPEIPASSDIKFEALKAQKLQNMIVTLGYDGVDSSKTMAPRQGKDVRLFITLTGQPIANLVANTGNHPAAITETFDLILPCVDECSDSCGANVDCNAVADAIIKQVSERKTIGGIQLVDGVNGESGFLKLTKLIDCTTPSGLVVNECSTYELVVADLGDNIALGKVQAQYPGRTVTRASRTGIYSTYEVTCGAQPSAFTDTEPVAIPNCVTCPSGWTLVEEAYVYVATKAGDQAATAASGATGYVTGSGKILVAFDGVKTVVQFYSTSSDLATVAASIPTFGVTAEGTVQAVCEPDSPTTTAWTTSGKVCGKAEKVYQLSLTNACDGTSKLAELQAIYGDGVTLVENNTTTCTSLFHLTVESEQTCVDCADIDSQFFTFVKPQNYGISIWTEVAGQSSVYGTGCVCGVKFESAYVARDRKECFFQDVSAEIEPLFIYVSTTNPDFRDYSTLCNDDEAFPVTLLQTAQYRQGWGSVIAEQVKLSNFYFNNPWFSEPAVRDAVGYELGVDLQGYYDQYTLTWKAPISFGANVSGFGLSQFEQYEFSFYLPQGEGTNFANAINAWLASVGAETASI